MVTSRDGNWQEARLVALHPDSGSQVTVIKGGADARYVPSGHLVYVQDAVLMAVHLRPGESEANGFSRGDAGWRHAGRQRTNGTRRTGIGQFAISASGNLIYASGGIDPARMETLVIVDRKRRANGDEHAERQLHRAAVLTGWSKAGRFQTTPTSRQSDIWVLDPSRGTLTRLTSQGTGIWPLWSPDGKRIFSQFPSAEFFGPWRRKRNNRSSGGRSERGSLVTIAGWGNGWYLLNETPLIRRFRHSRFPEKERQRHFSPRSNLTTATRNSRPTAAGWRTYRTSQGRARSTSRHSRVPAPAPYLERRRHRSYVVSERARIVLYGRRAGSGQTPIHGGGHHAGRSLQIRDAARSL